KIVDHIIPIKQGGKKLSEENLQSLCLACHNEKTKNELKG
ncbi:TPA: HNH endonuclease, partial [Campylobacter jejuni]|nr:HNH endonuclease [Campylobacter jejuni]